MANRWARASALLLGAIAVGVYIAVSQSQHRSDTTGPAQRPRDPFNENESSRVLRDFLAVMYNQSDNARETYAKALENLRARAEGVVPEIARIEASLREADYPTRFALIFTASELHHPSALPWLRSIALSRIPAERSSNPHSFSTVAEETILRTTAADGIGALARDGNAEAIEALFQCLATPSFSIRRAAVQQLLQSPNIPREHIAEALPEDQRFLLDLRRLDIRDVPQVRDPQQFLTFGVETHGLTSPPPSDSPGERPSPRSSNLSLHNPPPTLNRR